MVGKLFEHLVAGFVLAVLEIARNVDLLAVVAVVVEGPLERQVDEAGDLVAFADRDLPGDQWRNADRLKRGEEVADAAVRLVDTVDEDEMGNAELVERAESRRRQRRACGIWVDDDDREVGSRDRPVAVGGKADRSGAVE
jgi:hypothetical protein